MISRASMVVYRISGALILIEPSIRQAMYHTSIHQCTRKGIFQLYWTCGSIEICQGTYGDRSHSDTFSVLYNKGQVKEEVHRNPYTGRGIYSKTITPGTKQSDQFISYLYRCLEQLTSSVYERPKNVLKQIQDLFNVKISSSCDEEFVNEEGHVSSMQL